MFQELIRLSVGTEATTDILLDLDQAIAKATNTQPLLQQSEEDAIRWLLHSPFNREEKSLEKVIAVITSDEKETAFSHQLDQLPKLVFKSFPSVTLPTENPITNWRRFPWMLMQF